MRHGEVWLVNLDTTIGKEIIKTRPAVIVSSNSIGALPLRLIVPLTLWKEHYGLAPWMLKIEPSPENGLSKPSAADCLQIHSVPNKRLARKLGKLTPEEMEQIAAHIQLVVRD